MFQVQFNPFGAFVLAQFQAVNFRLRATRVRRLQKAKASNQNVIVGNIGAVRTGAQNASPVNA